MKPAMGLIISILGGLLIYDGFAGRSIWSDILAVLRGQANAAGKGNELANPNAAPNPYIAGGGDAQGSAGKPTAPAVTQIPNPFNRPANNPIGTIGRVR